MRYRRRAHSGISPTALSLARAVAAAVFLHGCSPKSDEGAQHNADADANQTEPAVTLTASQVSAIRIAPAGRTVFRNEKDAPGSVNFAEDPAIVQAESTLLGAAATFSTAQKELQRAQALYASKGVSQRELEQAISDQQSAKAALAAARSALSVLGKTNEQIDRVLAARHIPTSNSENSGSKWILANVNESDAAMVHKGQRVRVEIGAVQGRAYFGTVAEVYSVVDPSLHRVSVRAEVGDPNKELRSGMLADVHIAVGSPTEGVSIPENGVVREGDGTMTAWITTDRRRFVQRHIDIGARQDGRVQILNGIRVGELVAIDGAVLLDNMLQSPASE